MPLTDVIVVGIGVIVIVVVLGGVLWLGHKYNWSSGDSMWP